MLLENLSSTGAFGTVHEFVWQEGDGEVRHLALLVKFDKYIGPDFLRTENDDILVPVFMSTREFRLGNVSCTRTQFPVARPGYVITVRPFKSISQDLQFQWLCLTSLLATSRWDSPTLPSRESRLLTVWCLRSLSSSSPPKWLCEGEAGGRGTQALMYVTSKFIIETRANKEKGQILWSLSALRSEELFPRFETTLQPRNLSASWNMRIDRGNLHY